MKERATMKRTKKIVVAGGLPSPANVENTLLAIVEIKRRGRWSKVAWVYSETNPKGLTLKLAPEMGFVTDVRVIFPKQKGR